MNRLIALFVVLVFSVCSSFSATTLTVNGTAPRRIQTVFPRNANHTITVIGDSFTQNYSLGTMPYEFYPEVLAGYLRSLGCTVKARNFGVSGNTSIQMLARAQVLTRYETADIGIIYAGANDAASFATAVTQLHVQGLIKCFKFGAITSVTNPAALPADTASGTRYVVMLDDATTGGLPAYGALKTTITGSGGSVQSVWECRNLNAGTNGWGRVAVAATAPTHTSKIIVVGMHFLNYTPNGETPSTELAIWDSLTGLRSAQIAAVAAENVGGATVVYNDTYSYMGALITSGQETQNSFSWHVGDANTHLDAHGEQILAQSLLEKIQAQSGWITSLK